MTPAQQMLSNAFDKARLSEKEGMNLLQDFGIVSDNAVWVADVADENAELAARWVGLTTETLI